MFKIESVPAPLHPFVKSAIGMRELEAGFRSSTGGLPPGGLKFEWPQYDGRSLSLVATLYLAELPFLHDWLPRDGVLLFFYDFESEPLGDDVFEADGWRVLWTADTTTPDGAVFEKPENLKEGFVSPTRPLSFEEGVTLPFEDHPLFEEVGLSDELMEELDAVVEVADGAASGHLGGYSGAAEGALYAFRCRQQILGENPMLAYEANLAEIQEAEKEMCLLFEYEMNEREGDAAPEIFGSRNLSFWAFKADVKQQDFSKVWLRVERD